MANLELTEEANKNLERSVLDCAIHIALNMLELILIVRIIEGNNKPITIRDIDDVRVGNWEKFVIDDKMTIKYLQMIPDLEKLQK